MPLGIAPLGAGDPPAEGIVGVAGVPGRGADGAQLVEPVIGVRRDAGAAGTADKSSGSVIAEAGRALIAGQRDELVGGVAVVKMLQMKPRPPLSPKLLRTLALEQLSEFNYLFKQ